MNQPTDDPLDRALSALHRLHTPSMSAEAALAWQELRGAIQEARDERETLLAVTREAWDLVDAMEDYQEALDAGDPERIAELAVVCEAAEASLTEALAQVRAGTGNEPDP